MSQNVDFERLETVGKNLFNLWRRTEYPQPSNSDMEIKQTLLDGAKSLENSNIDSSDIAFLMILLLLSVYGHKGRSAEWAVSKIKINNKQDLPRNVQKSLNAYL